MTESKWKGRLLAIIFGVILFALLGLVSLTFFTEKHFYNSKKTEVDAPIDTVWKYSNSLDILLKNRENLYKVNVLDTLMPKWVEYYSPTDSTKIITSFIKPNTHKKYRIINEKYQQIHFIDIQMSKRGTKTEVLINEHSIYQNIWSRVYHTVIQKNLIVEFEMHKIIQSLPKKTR